MWHRGGSLDELPRETTGKEQTPVESMLEFIKREKVVNGRNHRYHN